MCLALAYAALELLSSYFLLVLELWFVVNYVYKYRMDQNYVLAKTDEDGQEGGGLGGAGCLLIIVIMECIRPIFYILVKSI